MTRTALSALLGHWRRQPVQLAALIVGLALATALWSAVQAINAEARASYDRAASVLSFGAAETLEHRSGKIPLKDYVALRRAGWLVSPILEGRLRTAAGPVTITGLEPLTAPSGAFPPAEGATPEAPDLLTPPGMGVAATETIARFDGVEGLTRLRRSAALAPGRIVTDIGTAARLLESPDHISRLLVLPDQSLGQPRLDMIAPDLIRVAAAADGSDVARLTASFHLNLTAFGLLSFAVGLFIVQGAIGLAFEQRRATFRTLRALGLPLRHLILLLLAELMCLAVVAGALGVALGYLLAGLLLPDVAATLRGLYGAEVAGGLWFDPLWALAAMGIATVGTLVAAAQAIWRVAQMPLLSSARPRAWALASATAMRRQALGGLVLLAGGALAPVVADGLGAGFALLGGLLLGSALLMPLLLSGLILMAERFARRPLAQWFWADTRQQLPGLSLALMALLLALATNIGVATMVASFRTTFTGWLDQRLSAELYITAISDQQARALEVWLYGRADAVLPIVSAEVRLGGAPGRVYGILDHATYRDNWPLLRALPDVWTRIAADDGILINEQLAYRTGLSLGDPLTLAPGWTLPVAGIYSDYGNPAGQALIGMSGFAERFPDAPRRQFGLRTATPAALTASLTDDFGLPPGAITDNGTIKAASLSVFERTFTVTGALNALTLGVAGIAILTALLTLSSLRLPQLAPVWSMGLTRRRLASLEALRSVVLAAVTFVLAVPVGLGLAWALLSVVNVEAFGWRLPMQVFPAQWAGLLGLALVAALLAAAWPARKLARTSPATFLKVFADER